MYSYYVALLARRGKWPYIVSTSISFSDARFMDDQDYSAARLIETFKLTGVWLQNHG